MTELEYLPAHVLAHRIRTRAVSCTELLDHQLARIEHVNPVVNAIVAMDVDAARARAKEADEAIADGTVWGPLHGIAITVKDCVEVVGMPTTAGVPQLAKHHPLVDAPTVQRLKAAGAIILGKTNAPAWAADHQSYNAIYGTTKNPFDLGRTPGGSSGGSSAALAAGLTPLELGSDIGGSIRGPAHHCGVFGHKPSYGIVPARGHIPPAPGALYATDINVLGPLARDADDLAMALDILAGPDEMEDVGWQLALPHARAHDIRQFRVAAWLDDPTSPVDGLVADRLQDMVDVLARNGVSVDTRARPAIDMAAAYDLYLDLLYSTVSRRVEGVQVLEMRARSETADPLSRDYGDRYARGVSLSHRDWLVRHHARQLLRRRWQAFFRDYDVLLAPAIPVVPFPHDQSDDRFARTVMVNGEPRPYWDQIFWAGIFGMAYLPATVMPAGLTPPDASLPGLPVGLQIVGPYLEDHTTIAFARALSHLTGGFVAPPNFP